MNKKSSGSRSARGGGEWLSVNVILTLIWKLTARFCPIQSQERGKHEIWHKDAFRHGEFKLIWSHAITDVRTISGGFSFSAHMFACKDENVKFFSL